MAPNAFEKLAAAQHEARPGHEVVKQPELGRGKLYVEPVESDAMALVIELQRAGA